MTLETVKNYCDITWNDSQTDAKVQGILDRAQNKLNEFAGAELDYTDETTVIAQLLLDCCWYILNRKLDEFEINYGPELIALRAERQAEAYAEANDSDV